MKIPFKELVIVCESFWPVVGGGERHAADLAATLVQRGWKVRILTRRIQPEWKEEEIYRGITITRLGPIGPSRWAKYAMGRQVRHYIRRHKMQIALLYVAGFRILGAPVVREAKALDLPVVLRAEACGELSGEYIWNSPHASRSSTWLRLIFRPLICWRNRTLREADGFLAIANVIDAEFAGEGVSSLQRVILPNGIDFQRFQPPESGQKPTLRQQLHLPIDKFIFSYAGKLNRGKGLESLLEAFHLLENKDTFLLLIGASGGMFLGCEKELKEQCQRFGLQNRVGFTGYVERVEDYLQASDAFVFPSEMEAFGLAPLEAAACGLPVVSTCAGALVQTMREGETAWTFPVGDPKAMAQTMRNVLQEPEERQRRAKYAYDEYYQNYSMEAVASLHENWFHHLLRR